MASYRTNGVPPKPEAKRRRRNKPASYGAARPTTAPPAEPTTRELGINGAHPLVQDMWNTVQPSREAAVYSETDWERLRLELWFANHTMASGRPSDQAWAAIQHGLNELLLSPAGKRRGGSS